MLNSIKKMPNNFLSATVVLFVFLASIFAPFAGTSLASAANIEDVYLEVDVKYFGNYTPTSASHPANMTDDVYVGTVSSPFGSGRVSIPLTHDGVTIIDPTSNGNVPGLHISRQNGFIDITAYSFSNDKARESVFATFSFENAKVTKSKNSSSQPFENAYDGKCGIVSRDNNQITCVNNRCGAPSGTGNAANNNPANDEFFFYLSSGHICSTTSTGADKVRVYYSPTVVIPTPTPNPTSTLNGSCSANPSSADIGESITWKATASGGNGSYQYVWSGTDSLSSSNQTVNKAYSSAGRKTATVVITSGSKSITRNCSAVVAEDIPASLHVSCSPSRTRINVNESVTWQAAVSGGNGSYQYVWSGTDGLSGKNQDASWSYNNSGTKKASIIVNSGNQTASASCSLVVDEEYNDNHNDDLEVSCSASDSNIETDEDVTWRASVSGGDGGYEYEWDGTDNLHGHSRNLTWSYDDEGTKKATITVESDGQIASDTCSLKVNDDDDDDEDDLEVNCRVSPSNPQVGERVKLTCSVSGGDGDYDYDWDGSEGLHGSNRTVYMTYDTAGRKYATMTVTDEDDNEESDTVRFDVNSVLGYSESNTPLASAVYLSQIPYTGIADNYKLYGFVVALIIFSAWISYIIIERKKEAGELN